MNEHRAVLKMFCRENPDRASGFEVVKSYFSSTVRVIENEAGGRRGTGNTSTITL